MGRRILSTLSLWTITVVCFFVIGPDAAVLVTGLLSVATQYEFYGLLGLAWAVIHSKKFGIFLGLIIILVPYYANKLSSPIAGGIQSGIIAVTIVACCVGFFASVKWINELKRSRLLPNKVIYVPFMLNYLVRLIELPGDSKTGLMLVVWLMCKFTDVGALLSGKAFGSRPMSPVTSPKKTWEGAIGGCIISRWTWLHAISLCRSRCLPRLLHALVGHDSSLADGHSLNLVRSRRKHDKADGRPKDSGSFIPGIGGAFDLTDSLILTAPTGYLLLSLLALGS